MKTNYEKKRTNIRAVPKHNTHKSITERLGASKGSVPANSLAKLLSFRDSVAGPRPESKVSFKDDEQERDKNMFGSLVKSSEGEPITEAEDQRQEEEEAKEREVLL